MTIDDIELLDGLGTAHRLDDWPSASGLKVVAFVGVECPLSKRYGPRLAELSRDLKGEGVPLIAVDSNQQDSLDEIAAFAERTGLRAFKDPDSRLADLLGAERVTEAFVMDRNGAVRYRGRIDDQYQVGVERNLPTRRDLFEAIHELLQGKPVSVPDTQSVGCYISRPYEPGAASKVTYAQDIAPIVRRRCQACHRIGEAAPFALASYEDAAAWAATIREVVADRRMPPWNAAAPRGQFANDLSLTDDERQAILDWVDCGTPAGSIAKIPPASELSTGWSLDSPDVTLEMPRAFQVPSDGPIDYQFFAIDPGFRQDRWISAVEIRPGNRSVVHHATLFLMPPGISAPVEHGSHRSFCITAMAPGTGPTTYPEGMAKHVPAGWHFLLVVHYVAVGSPQSDRTKIAIRFADHTSVHQEVATWLIVDEHLRIPPHEPNHRVEHAVTLNDDVLLLAMFPHMHLRGKSFSYEASYPDGSHETLLSVPRYDFSWQHRYVLAQPKRLSRGTVLRCIAIYDNSPANPNNPDPNITVGTGPQSTDEMFNGYLDVALANEYLQSRSSRGLNVLWCSRLTLFSIIGVTVVRQLSTRKGAQRKRKG